MLHQPGVLCCHHAKCGVAPQGFNPAEVADAYGDTLTFWDWRERKMVQTIKLGADGLIPLVRLWPWSTDHCAKLLYFKESQCGGVCGCTGNGLMHVQYACAVSR